jgi:uncharacterized membrane protein
MVSIAAAIFAVISMASSVQGQSGPNITAQGFSLDDGIFSTIDHPDAASSTVAFGVNNRSQIVGSYVDAKGTTHGFLLHKGKFTTIDVPGASGVDAFGLSGSAPADINNRGQIVGSYVDAGTLRGFLLDKDTFTTFDVPGATRTAPHKINDRGQIVGGYFDAEGTLHGFLLDKGAFANIDVPGAAMTDQPASTTVARLWAPSSMMEEQPTAFCGMRKASSPPSMSPVPSSSPPLSASTIAARSWGNTSMPLERAVAFCWTTVSLPQSMFQELSPTPLSTTSMIAARSSAPFTA